MIPAEIVVGPFTYQVTGEPDRWLVGASDMAESYGITDHGALTIYLHPGMPPDLAAETLLHEVMHAGMFVAGTRGCGADTLTEEECITRLAPLLLDSLRRSPGLIDYLRAA